MASNDLEHSKYYDRSNRLINQKIKFIVKSNIKDRLIDQINHFIDHLRYLCHVICHWLLNWSSTKTNSNYPLTYSKIEIGKNQNREKIYRRKSNFNDRMKKSIRMTDWSIISIDPFLIGTKLMVTPRNPEFGWPNWTFSNLMIQILLNWSRVPFIIFFCKQIGSRTRLFGTHWNFRFARLSSFGTRDQRYSLASFQLKGHQWYKPVHLELAGISIVCKTCKYRDPELRVPFASLDFWRSISDRIRLFGARCYFRFASHSSFGTLNQRVPFSSFDLKMHR